MKVRKAIAGLAIYVLVTLVVVNELYMERGLHPEVEALIHKLNEATAKARDQQQLAPAVSESSNCRSSRSLASLFPEDESGAVFNKVFKAYSAMHAACVRSSNLSKFPGAPSSCKFLVVEFGQPYGLGNKLLWLISAFLYSILTQRVLLLDTRFALDKLLCEPFAASSWKLPERFPYTDSAEATGRWTDSHTFFNNSLESSKSKYQAVKMNDGWDLDKRYFCDQGQDLLQDVTWLAFGAGGCLYILPGFFLVPKFKKTLEALFPHRNPATHLLRHLLAPVDSIWSEITKVRNTYFSPATTSFGAQVRYFDDAGNVSLKIPKMTDCAIKAGLIPVPGNSTSGNVTIFIASLSTGLHDHLQDLYSNSSVHIIQISSNKVQINDLHGDTQALIEIIGLSLSQSLMTTRNSTFGYVAQSLGGLTPWLIGEDCSRGHSSEPCYHAVVSSGPNESLAGHLEKCQGHQKGYQLKSH